MQAMPFMPAGTAGWRWRRWSARLDAVALHPIAGPLLLALLLFAAFTSAAQAQDARSGRLLASNCFQCHGTDGKGPGFEKLAGKSASDIYHELVDMRAGKEGDGLMSRHAMGYTDAQLRAIAQYFGSRR